MIHVALKQKGERDYRSHVAGSSRIFLSRMGLRELIIAV
jgi:hypothetical protein